jgi:hypothetical protein
MNKLALVSNIDFYINTEGNLVFTEKYHLDRGYCCQSGCLHCPYSYNKKVDPNVPAEFSDAWISDDVLSNFENDDDDEEEEEEEEN